MNKSSEKVLELIFIESREAIININVQVYEENIELLLEIFEESVKNTKSINKSKVLRQVKENIINLIHCLVENRQVRKRMNEKTYLELFLEKAEKLDCLEFVIDEIVLSIEKIIEYDEIDLAKRLLIYILEKYSKESVLDTQKIQSVLYRYIEEIKYVEQIKEANFMRIDLMLSYTVEGLIVIEDEWTKNITEPVFNYNIKKLYKSYLEALSENNNIDNEKYRLIIVERITNEFSYKKEDYVSKEIMKILFREIEASIKKIESEDSMHFQFTMRLIDKMISIRDNKVTNSIILSIFVYLYYLNNTEENKLYYEMLKKENVLLGSISIKEFIKDIKEIWNSYSDVVYILDGYGDVCVLKKLIFEIFLILSSINYELDNCNIDVMIEEQIKGGGGYYFLSNYFSQKDFKLDKNYGLDIYNICKMMDEINEIPKVVSKSKDKLVEFFKKKHCIIKLDNNLLKEIKNHIIDELQSAKTQGSLEENSEYEQFEFTLDKDILIKFELGEYGVREIKDYCMQEIKKFIQQFNPENIRFEVEGISDEDMSSKLETPIYENVYRVKIVTRSLEMFLPLELEEAKVYFEKYDRKIKLYIESNH